MTVEHVPGKKVGDIMLYALSTCGWCRKTRELLQEMGVDYSYEYVDLLDGAEKRRGHEDRSPLEPELFLPHDCPQQQEMYRRL